MYIQHYYYIVAVVLVHVVAIAGHTEDDEETFSK